MSNSSDTYWDVNGESLQTFAFNITSWGGDREAPPAVRGSDTVVPYVPGRSWSPRLPDSRVITLGMWVIGADENGNVPHDPTSRALFEKNWKHLRRLLYKPRRQILLTKRFRLFGDPTLYTATAKASYASGLNPQMNGQTRAVFTVDLLLSDPYFYGTPVEIEIDPKFPQKTVEILGDDRTMEIQAEISGYTKRLRLERQGDDIADIVYLDYNNELPVGQTANLDIKNFLATQVVDSTGVTTKTTAKVEHVGDPFWFFLEPGENVIGIQEMDVPSRGTEWTNLLTDPSFETGNAPDGVDTNTVLKNLATNPSFETAGVALGYSQAINLKGNPRMSAPGSTVEFRRNKVRNPSFDLPSIATNLVTNPRVGTTATGWTINGGTATGSVAPTRVATGGPSSDIPTYASGVCTSSGSGAFNVTPGRSALFPMTRGYYTVIAWVRSPVAAATAFLGLEGFDGSSNPILNSQGANFSVPANVWTEIRSTIFMDDPAMAQGRVAANFLLPNGVTSREFQVTGYAVVPTIAYSTLDAGTRYTPYRGGYFDGAMTNFVVANPRWSFGWAGTAHASASTKKEIAPRIINRLSNPSFEAGTGTFTKRTNLATNPSAETATTGYAAIGGTGGTAAVTSAAPSTATAFGTKVLKCTWSVASTAAGGGAYYTQAVTAGTTYSFSFGHVKSSIANRLRMVVNFFNGSSANVGTVQGPVFAVGAGSIFNANVFYLAGVLAPTGAVSCTIAIISEAGTGYANWSAASYLELDGLLVEARQTMLPYFDGSSTGVDTTFAWTGTANASTSNMLAVPVTGAVGTNCLVSRVLGVGAVSRPYALEILPTSTTTSDSFVDLEGGAGGLRSGMVAGKTYTLLGTCTLVNALASTVSPVGSALTLSVIYKVGSGAYTSFSSSAKPNVATTTNQLRLEFTLPAGTTEAWVRLYNGYAVPDAGTNLSNAVIWDDVALVDREDPLASITYSSTTDIFYTGGYFDGATQAEVDLDYSWSGTADASPSYGTPTGYTGTRNLVRDPIPASTSTWPTWGSATYTSAIDNTDGPSPYTTQCIKSTYTAGTYASWGFYWGTGTNAAPVQARKGYVGSLYVKGSWTGATATLSARFFDQSGNIISGSGTLGTVSLTTGWQRVSGFLQAPENAKYMGLSIALSGGSPSIGATFSVAAAQIELGYTVSEYFDGNTGNTISPVVDQFYSWQGAANASSPMRKYLSANDAGSFGTAFVHETTEWDDTDSYIGIPNPENPNQRLRGRGLKIIPRGYPGLASLSGAVLTRGLLPDTLNGTYLSFMLTVQIPTVLTGTLHANKLSMFMTWVDASGVVQRVFSSSLSNITGKQLLRWTVAAPTSVTGNIAVGFIHGGGINSGIVYVDNLLCVSTNQATGWQANYFSGDSPKGAQNYPYWDTGFNIDYDTGASYSWLTSTGFESGDTGSAINLITVAAGDGVASADSVSNDLVAGFLGQWRTGVSAQTSPMLVVRNLGVSTSAYYALHPTLLPGRKYTIKGKVWGYFNNQNGTAHANAGRMVLTYNNGSGPITITSNQPVYDPVTGPPIFSSITESNDWGQLSMTFTLPATVTGLELQLWNGVADQTLSGFRANSENFWSEILITEIPLDSPGWALGYFDGSTDPTPDWSHGTDTSNWQTPGYGRTVPDSDFINEWIGTADIGQSKVGLAPIKYMGQSAQHGGVTGQGIAGGSSLHPVTGTKSIRVIPDSTNDSYALVTNTMAALTTNTTYYVRARAFLPAPLTGTLHANARKVVPLWSAGSITVVSETVVPNIAGFNDYELVFTTPATGGFMGFRLYDGAAQGGGEIFWDTLLVIANFAASAQYFDGSFSSLDPDLGGGWSGAANDSTSVLRALLTQKTFTGKTHHCVAVVSNKWVSDASRSMRILPIDNSNESYVGGSPASFTHGMAAGKTYTFSAQLHLIAAQTGVLHANARTLQIFYTDAGGVDHVFTSAQAPNVLGTTQDLSVTATIPADALGASIRMWNGASYGNGDVYYDKGILIEVEDSAHPYQGIWFDGSTPDTDFADFEWTGTANASTSIIRGVASAEPVKITYQPMWL